MPTDADPIVDNWYCHQDKGQRFCVVAVDESAGVVEIQNFDGDVEEMELKEWYEMDVEPSDEPENWSGATDVGEMDDLGTEVTDTTPDDWNDPLRQFPSPDQK